MTTKPSETPKKTRKRRSPEMIAELIFEAERKGNAAEICRREEISPNLFYRWRQKAKEGAIQALAQIKRGPKAKDAEKTELRAENERLTRALCEASIELQLLKKSVGATYTRRSKAGT
jgi:transposase-like protein